MKRLLLILFLLATPLAAQDLLASQDPALVQAAKSGDPQAAFELGSNLAAAGREPDLRAALPWLRQAYRDAKALNPANPLLVGQSALVLSRVLANLSQPRNALDLAIEAQTAFETYTATATSDRYLVAMALEDQATLLQNLSRYPESILLLERARGIYEASLGADSLAVGNTWLNQGVGHEGANDLDAALLAYGSGLAIFRAQTGDESREVGALANNIGWIYLRQKNHAEARDWFLLAQGILEKLDGRFTPNSTTLQINLGLVSLGEGKLDEAVRWGMQALPYLTANRAQTLDDQRWNFEMLSRAFAEKGDPARAILFGKLAVNAQQEFRAANTVSGAQDLTESQREWFRLYQRLADLLIGQGRISEAQAVLNMAKEEEVFEFLQRDASADLSETRSHLTPRETADQQQLANLAQAPIAAAQALQALMVKFNAGTATAAEEEQIYALQDQLQAASDAFDQSVAAFLAAAPPAQQQGLQAQFDAVGSYQAVLAELDRPTAILQIAALDHATHLFLTLPGATLHQEVKIEKADLARQVFETLEAIEAVSPDAQTRLAALYRVIFAPVDQALATSGTKVIMLNLDGFLRYVPFAALHDGKGYLVQRFAFTLYSPAVPTQFSRADRAAAATAGFGVTQAHPGFSALPGVAKELTTIFGASGVLAGETALDAGFDERSLKRALLAKPGVLHIASHFNLVPGREDDSFLLLGDGTHLSLAKIRSTRALRFQGVDLLTLSACQTARGGDGAEIDGFGATAQLNGAAAVMASLWPVSDAATPRLMRDFYAGMMGQGFDKAEALRQAQVAMLTGAGAELAEAADRSAEALDGSPPPPKVGLEHPYFWSAFVLMGNWL